MTRRRVLLACLLAGVLGSMAPGMRALAQDAGPAAPIVALDNALLGVMHAGHATPFSKRMAMLSPVVQQTYALDVVLRSSVGPRWAGLSVADRAALLDAFTDFTVASYVGNFAEFNGERLVVKPEARAAGANQVVHSQIVPAHGGPVSIDYVMRQGEDGWRVVDVLLDGSISRVAVQRSDFRALLSGGTAGPLIASLRKRIEILAKHG